MVEQEKNRLSMPLFVFEVKGVVRIAQEHVLLSVPIGCHEEEGRFRVEEEDFRRIVLEIKMIISHEESDDSSFDRYSESHQHMYPPPDAATPSTTDTGDDRVGANPDGSKA